MPSKSTTCLMVACCMLMSFACQALQQFPEPPEAYLRGGIREEQHTVPYAEDDTSNRQYLEKHGFGQEKVLDDESVLSMARHVRREQAKLQQQSCKCLNWLETYSPKWHWHVPCGSVHERNASDAACEWFMGIDGFGKTFLKQNHNYCVNEVRGIGLGGLWENPDTWCYVPSYCKDLNGGARVKEEVSWKKCKAGEDAILGELSPQELFDLAWKIKVDDQGMVNLAYGFKRDGANLSSSDFNLAKMVPGDNKHQAALTVRWGKQTWLVDDVSRCMSGC